jgi:hypothetical protein
VKEGVYIDHLEACGNYIIEKMPDVIINLGDFADMPSLNSHEDRASKYFHDKSYTSDIESTKEAMELLLAPLKRYNKGKKRNRYSPRMVLTTGNHEYRIDRCIHNLPVLQGKLCQSDLEYEKFGWEVYPYQHIVEIDGILYSHNFCNPDSLRNNVIGGTIENKIRRIGQSFCMGHQQKRQFGTVYTATGKEMMGLVVGRFYQHEEDYLGPQGQSDWSGVVLKHEVKDGRYDPCFVSMQYLLDNYL